MLIQITAKHYNALQAAMADCDVRYYLNGFCVDRAEGKCVATDGHRLIAVPYEVVDDSDPDITDPAVKSPPDANSSLIYSNADGKPRKLPRKGKPDCVVIDTARDTAEVRNVKGETINKIAFDRIDGRFPDWRKVMPNGDALKALESIAFDATLVADIYSAIEAVSARYSFRGADKAIEIEFGGDNKGVECVVMPMRW